MPVGQSQGHVERPVAQSQGDVERRRTQHEQVVAQQLFAVLATIDCQTDVARTAAQSTYTVTSALADPRGSRSPPPAPRIAVL